MWSRSHFALVSLLAAGATIAATFATASALSVLAQKADALLSGFSFLLDGLLRAGAAMLLVVAGDPRRTA